MPISALFKYIVNGLLLTEQEIGLPLRSRADIWTWKDVLTGTGVVGEEKMMLRVVIFAVREGRGKKKQRKCVHDAVVSVPHRPSVLGTNERVIHFSFVLYPIRGRLYRSRRGSSE